MNRPPALLLLAALAAALAAGLAAGACAKRAKSPTAPPAAVEGLRIVATSPPARAERALYDTEVWAQFDRALDATTVDTAHVYLKIDAQRLPIRVRYDGITDRVIVEPRNALATLTTYTVEFGPTLRAFDGTELGARAFFQFTTNSLRRPRYDFPSPDTLESPVASLFWSGNGPQSATFRYELYAGPDSLLVSSRSLAPLQTGVFLSYVPRTRWPSGTRVYWAVTANNTQTGERLDGPVARFDTFAADAPVDSLVVDFLDWGGLEPNRPRTQLCFDGEVYSGPQFYNAGMRWRFGTGTPRPTMKLADARIELFTNSTYQSSIEAADVSLWFATSTWSPCAFTVPGPPFADVNGLLAHGRSTATPMQIAYHADALAAYVQDQTRRVGTTGVLLRSTARFPYETPYGSGPVPPRLVLTHYRPPAPAGARAHAASRRVAR